MPKPKPPTTIGDNPLEAMVSAAATLAAIQGMAPKSPAMEPAAAPRVPLTVNLPIRLVRELQTVVAVQAGMDIDRAAEAALRGWLRLRGKKAAGAKRSAGAKGAKKAAVARR